MDLTDWATLGRLATVVGSPVVVGVAIIYYRRWRRRRPPPDPELQKRRHYFYARPTVLCGHHRLADLRIERSRLRHSRLDALRDHHRGHRVPSQGPHLGR